MWLRAEQATRKQRMLRSRPGCGTCEQFYPGLDRLRRLRGFDVLEGLV